MRIPATMRWVALALLGMLIAAGISIAASHLASQQIGLASEPISAGDALAPTRERGKTAHRPVRAPSRDSKPQPVIPPQPAAPATSAPPSPSPQTGEPSQPAGDGENGGGGADD